MTTRMDVPSWFSGRVPDDWFRAAPSVEVDGDEILVIGEIDEPVQPPEADEAARAAARAGRVTRFREETRDVRMRIAEDAQQRFGRKVSWGVACGGETVLFTTLNVPVMTRLRFRERRVLDTLVDAGVARSRSEALAWCVRLVGQHEDDWLRELRGALAHVERVRADGPGGMPGAGRGVG